VQLSDNLRLPSRHHLELMMEESQMFLSYFRGGIFYLEGGVESGFKHVEPKVYEKRLFIVKGKRYPRVWTMPLASSSLNEGDLFILDLGLKLYFWPGVEANVNEKVKGMEILFNIKNAERGGHPVHFYPREDANADEEFWAELGGKPTMINPAVPDEGVQEGGSGELTYSLYRVSNATGQLELTEVTERPLQKTHLDTNDTFILELSDQIYVWVGKKSNLEEKKNAMKFAKDFIEQKGKPKNTRISRLPEFGEDVHFKSFFNGFYPCIAQDYGKFKNIDTSTANFDIEKMANKEREAAKQLFDMLSHFSMDMYHVREGQPQLLDQGEWGHVFADDLYIVDLKGERHRYVLMWTGPKLDPEEYSATSRFMDMVTNYENSNLITRNRVRRGHEEESLLSLFPNGFVVHLGARVPLGDKLAQVRQLGAMFRIQAPFGASARAIEQEQAVCASLNSGDAYIVISRGGYAAYLWLGEGANEPEEKLGRQLLDGLFAFAEARMVFREGEEPEEFWDALGGRTEYSSVKDTGVPSGFEPRLFHCSNSSGYFYVKEILNFGQEDMMNDDIMLLDAYNTVYVWIGNKSNAFEKKGAFKSATKYVQSIKDERDKDAVNIVEVEAGKEPPAFTVHFPLWR